MQDTNATSQALAQLASIHEMVAALEAAELADDDSAREQAEQAIREDALSIEVRSDWTSLERNLTPGEYRICLCTGGPAVQIWGALNHHREPDTAYLQCQDWFTPWTAVPASEDDTAALLRYASVFYFGE